MTDFDHLLPHRTAARALLAVAAVLVMAPTARADDLVYRDPETCAETTVRGVEVVSETWTEIKYRERARGPEKSVPTAMLLKIDREDKSPQARDLLTAIGELERGHSAEARRALQALSGGGYMQNLETGKREYKSFAESDPPGRSRRPPWTNEYAHYYYAKALHEEGEAKEDRDLLEQAWLALVDQKLPTGQDGTTGGFLGRFEGGNSRFYASAMALAGHTAVVLGKTEEARKLFKDLEDKAIAMDIGPRWAMEAKLGPSEIAIAQGKYLDAINAATDAANVMKLMLRNETRGCVRHEIGRYYSRARMAAASVMLQQAEKTKSPAEFRRLRDFIEEGMPEKLRQNLGTLPSAQLEALVAGALDPQVQAVAQNGRGLAYLYEQKYEDAILAFRAVEVKYFQTPEEHARALHYLAEAADRAAQAARKPEAKKLYEAWRDQARERLKREHPNTTWARGS